MSSRWTGFFVWALATACAALWGFKIFAATRPVPPTATTPSNTVVAEGPMVRLFGAPKEEEPEVAAAPPPESDRFQLVGVISPRGGGDGFALVSVDNQPARAWKVGATIEGATTLVTVDKRSAGFGPSGGPASFTLELPEPAAPETGTLPDAVSQPNGAAPVPRAATAPVPQQPGMVIPGAVRGGAPVNMARPGMPLRPGMQPGMPGMIPPNAVPPGRTVPTAGAQQVQPAVQDGAQVEKDDE